MDFEPTAKVVELTERLQAFMTAHVLPIEREFVTGIENADNKWTTPPVMLELQEKARAEGLWNLFLPDAVLGAGLTNLEYASFYRIIYNPL